MQRRRSNSFTDSYSPRDPAEDDSGSPVVVRPLTTVAARACGSESGWCRLFAAERPLAVAGCDAHASLCQERSLSCRGGCCWGTPPAANASALGRPRRPAMGLVGLARLGAWMRAGVVCCCVLCEYRRFAEPTRIQAWCRLAGLARSPTSTSTVAAHCRKHVAQPFQAGLYGTRRPCAS